MGTRREHGGLVSSIISSNPDLTEDRAAALEMIQRFNKNPYIASASDISWFWYDLDLDDSENYQGSKEELKDEVTFSKVNKNYPFELTEWLMEWYDYVPDAIKLKVDGAGQIDFNLYFTLIIPIKTLGYSFKSMIKALNARQNQIGREQLFRTIYENEELRNKVLDQKPLPPIYTHYLSYGRIYREIVKRHKNATNPPRVTYRRQDIPIFLKVKTLVDSGIPLEEALKVYDSAPKN